MEYSGGGLRLTKQFESCRLTAYRDVKGILTIGWGHTGPEVVEGLVWTQEQADQALYDDTMDAQDCVNAVVKVPLTQGEFDALVDFTFNAGRTAFKGSTMLALLNQSNYHGAAGEFEKWDHASGKVVAGLLRRRIAEEQEFNNGIQS